MTWMVALACLLLSAPVAEAKRETLHGKAEVAVVDLADGSVAYETNLNVGGTHRKLTFGGKRRTPTPPFRPGARVRIDGEVREDGTLELMDGGEVTAEPVLDPNRNRGARRVAIVPAWTDANALVLDVAAFRAALTTTTAAVLEGSAYGRMPVTIDLLPARAVGSGLCDLPEVVERAMRVDCTRDWTAYHFVQVVHSRDCGWIGLAGLGPWTLTACGQTFDVGASVVTTQLGVSYAAGAGAHELGHNLGLHHDGALTGCGPADLGDPSLACREVEYGGWTGTMGNSRAWGLFEPSQSQAGGWLDPGEWIDVRASGTYALAPVGALTGPKMLAIPRPFSHHRLYMSFRSRATPNDAGMETRAGGTSYRAFGGLLFHLADAGTSNGYKPLLIDASPGVPTTALSLVDPRLLPGATFTDAGTGTRVTLLAMSDTAATVQVELGGASTSSTSSSSTSSTVVTTSTVAPPPVAAGAGRPWCVPGGVAPPRNASGQLRCGLCCSDACVEGVCRAPAGACLKPRTACAESWACCRKKCGRNGRCQP